MLRLPFSLSSLAELVGGGPLLGSQRVEPLLGLGDTRPDACERLLGSFPVPACVVRPTLGLGQLPLADRGLVGWSRLTMGAPVTAGSGGRQGLEPEPGAAGCGRRRRQSPTADGVGEHRFRQRLLEDAFDLHPTGVVESLTGFLGKRTSFLDQGADRFLTLPGERSDGVAGQLLLGGAQRRAEVEEPPQLVSPPACQPVDRPGTDGWLPERGDGFGELPITLLASVGGPDVARRREFAGSQPIELLGNLADVHPPSLQARGPPGEPDELPTSPADTNALEEDGTFVPTSPKTGRVC